jgi:glycine cleavage system H protein
MDFPEDLRYTREHEWARRKGERIVIGITDFAQDQLGDVVFVGLPEPGTEVSAGKPLGEVESTKSVSDIYAPVTGTITERNARLEESPDLVNQDPYGEGWMVLIASKTPAELDGLLSATQYQDFIASEQASS